MCSNNGRQHVSIWPRASCQVTWPCPSGVVIVVATPEEGGSWGGQTHIDHTYSVYELVGHQKVNINPRPTVSRCRLR